MRIGGKLVALCLVCLSCLRLSAQDRRNALLSLPPFERAIICIKHFEGLHGFKDAPYVGYGYQLLPSEHFTAAMTERQADSPSGWPDEASDDVQGLRKRCFAACRLVLQRRSG